MAEELTTRLTPAREAQIRSWHRLAVIDELLEELVLVRAERDTWQRAAEIADRSRATAEADLIALRAERDAAVRVVKELPTWTPEW